MKLKSYTINYQNHEYVIPITYKRQRGLYLKVKDNQFVCSAPLFISEKSLKKFIDDSFEKLLKRVNKRPRRERPIGDDYIYLLGVKQNRQISNENLKIIALQYLTALTRDVEKEMNIDKPYKIKVKKMKTRYGSNSMKTHTINYQLDLIHYSKEIVRSVVVHELAHHYQRNHQSSFYKVVLKYCPEYYSLKAKLRKGQYQ